MVSLLKKITHILLSFLILSSTVTVLFSAESNAVTSLYGRAEYRGYFFGANSSGQPWANCSQGRGQLICGGITSTNINSFVSFYRNHLNGSNTQYARSAAFTVLVMLGVSGPSSGGASAGISKAKSRFSEWESIVRAYDAAGKINYNVNYTYNTNTAYRNGTSNSTRDVLWYNDSDTAKSIRFDIGGGRYVAIKRSCANMVGTRATLPPPTDGYSLDPSVTTNPSDSIETGADLTVSPVVDTVGPPATSPINWQISKVIVPPNVDIPDAANSSSNPCDYYGGSSRTCSQPSFSSGGGSSGSTVFTAPVYNFPNRITTADDVSPGTRICYGLSVQPRAFNSTQWRHSDLACVVVGAKPKVQIHGGDLLVGRSSSGQMAGRGTVTSTTTKTIGNSQRTFGSWVEYGIFATGNIVGTASGSAFAAPSGLSNVSSACNYSTLSWSNTLSSTGNLSCSGSNPIGGYQHQFSLPSVASKFPVGSSTASLGNNPARTLNSLQGVYTATGNITINASSISAGRWVVINAPDSDLTINGNISYSNGPFNSVEDIPQVIIIARNINIVSGVTNIDAWLVAAGTGSSGVINTCSSVGATADLTIDICNQRLTVNGPVIASSLLLRRTAGSGSGNNNGDPAEVFNLRPDAYLWAANLASASNKASTVYTVELPPRF